MEINEFSSSMILVKISYISVFLMLICAEYFLKSKRATASADEGREIGLNICIGLLFGVLSTFVNAVGLTLFKSGLSWFPGHQYSSWWMEFFVAFVTLDLMYYWNHRLNHKVPLMWKAHSVHHSGKHYNLSLGPRQSLVQSVFALPFYVPLIFLGISLPVFLSVSVVSILYQFLTHAHLTFDIPVLHRIFVLPRHHIVHHSSSQKDYDKNFGGVFIIWDHLFGTFQDYRDDIQIGATQEDRFDEQNSFWQKVLLVFYPVRFYSEYKGLR